MKYNEAALTWNVAEELFAEVPLGLTLVSVEVVLRPPGLLVAAETEQDFDHLLQDFIHSFTVLTVLMNPL